MLSSTNESGRPRLGCHHPGVLFQQYATSGTRTKVAAQNEGTAQKHQKYVAAQKHEFLPALQSSLDSLSTMGSCTGKVLATVDT